MKKNIPLSTTRNFKTNEEVRAYLLLKEKHLRLTRDGKPYLDVILSDKSGTIIGKIWEHAGEIEPMIETGAPVGVRAIVEDFRGNRQLNIKRIVPVNEEDFASKGFSWELILPQSESNSDKLWKFIEKSIAKVNNPHLLELIQLLIIDNRSKILKHPASLRLHHATMGGFLEHLTYMLNLGIHAAKQYKLDHDLVITGILLHDIGKLDELSGYPNNIYTDEGNFLGHVVLGYNMVDKAISKIKDFPEDLSLKIKHILLSHQGQYENQSPKKPAFPEALLIHYLDELDARMDMMKTAINLELDDGDWTSLKNYFRIPLYKSQKETNTPSGKPDKKTLNKNRKIAETGIFLALFLGLAYAFSYVPNLEYITAMAFLSGLLLGWKRGLFVALIGEAVFSIANPFGSSLAFPTLLAAQLLSYGFFALVGAWYRRPLIRIVEHKPTLAAFLLGFTGLLLTIFYNIMTTIFYAIPSGFTLEQTLASIISGVPFYLVNMIANTITFSVLITLILTYVLKHYPHYLKEKS